MLLKPYTYILAVKICLLCLWGIFLWLHTYMSTSPWTKETTHVYIIDLSHSMNIQDITYKWSTISRLDTVKKLISQSLYTSNQSIWIIWCNDSICSYLIPPTKNHENIEQQLSYLHTNMLRNKTTPLAYIPTETITFLSDGATTASFQAHIASLLRRNWFSGIILWWWDERVVLDPAWNILYENEIRQTHITNIASVNELAPRERISYESITDSSSILFTHTYASDTQKQMSWILILALFCISLWL